MNLELHKLKERLSSLNLAIDQLETEFNNLSKEKILLEPPISSFIRFYSPNQGKLLIFYRNSTTIFGWRLFNGLGLEIGWNWNEILKCAENQTIEISSDNWKTLK